LRAVEGVEIVTAASGELPAAFLAEVRKQLQGCHRTIEHCVKQLNDEQLWWRSGEGFNSIANLLLHLKGNIGQRIGSLVGGQPDRRNRDQEFAERGPISQADLMHGFHDTMRETDRILAELNPSRLFETRRYLMLAGEVEGTLITLILQTLVHLAGHTQEIVALTRLQLRERYRFQRS
jgi:uncharacterized protein DUF1572